jgi:EmrB/QacA subfamily drug resistance transporter
MTSSPPPVHKGWTLLAVCLGTFMLLLDVTIVVVALPDIRSSLHAGFSSVQWTIDAYSLSLAALLLPAGSLADRLGRRRVFAVGLAIFTVGSALCGAAQSPVMLVLCRVAQGVGGATIFATSLALLAQTFHGKERGQAFGIWGAVTAASTALGPVLGGVLVSWLGWRWIFFVNLPVGVFAIGVTLTRVAEWRPPHARRIDVLGAVWFTVALVALVYGLIRASSEGWGDGLVVACFVAAVVLLVSFPFVERARRDPMFDLALFKKPTFVGGSIAAFGMNGSLYAMFLYLVLYLQDVQHLSALGAGVRLAVITGATLLTAVPAGRLSAHMPVRWLVGPGLVIVGLGLLLMRGVDVGSSWTALLPGFIVAGLGSGLVNAPLASTAVGVVPPQQAGMASGVNSTFRQVGLATSVAAMGTIFSGRIAAGTEAAFVSGLDEILLITAILALSAGVLALALIRQKDFVVHGAPVPTAAEPGAAKEPALAAS